MNDIEKKKVLLALKESLQNSHAFKHLSGTTQTTTNGLSDSYIHKQSKKKEYRTTRQTHSIQVSDVSKHIAEQLGLNDIEISKAEIVALAHDIGHCVFGHDGESAFNEYLNSRSNSNLKDQQEYIKNRRLKLFGKSYENQLNMQDQICGWSSTAKYTYDHAEESAIVLREIVDKDLQEYKGLEGYSEFINEIVQGVLFHSKPAFKTNDNSSQIVSIADSMAFMLDDVNQFLGFGRINEKTANNLLKSAGLNYLNIEFFKDKEKVLNQAIQEVVAFQKQTRNNGKIYNGSHYRDIQWLIGKAVWSCSSNKIIEPNNYDIVKNKLIKICEDFLDTSIPQEKALAENIFATFDQIMESKPENISCNDLTDPLKTIISEQWKKTFPINFACNETHNVVTNTVIFGSQKQYDGIETEATGNQIIKDKGSIAFMLNQIECEYVDIAKQMGDDINVCEPIDIQKFKAIVCETATFKALISTMKSNQEFRGMTIPDFSEVNPENPASNSIECDLVFEELGFNEDVLADNFTSAELFVKLMARQTNEFFRSFEERTVANIMGVSYEEFRVLSAEERTLFEATSNAANVKNNNNYAKHVEREYQKKYDKQLKQDVLQGKEITITPEELSRINYNPYLTRVVSRLMKEKMLYIEDERAV